MQATNPNATPQQSQPWECGICEIDTGHKSTALVSVILEAEVGDGRITGGTQAWACASCLSRGKITRAT